VIALFNSNNVCGRHKAIEEMNNQRAPGKAVWRRKCGQLEENGDSSVGESWMGTSSL